MKNNKQTWANIAWFVLGVLFGIVLAYYMVYWGLYGLLNTQPIQHLTINLNETQIINAMIDMIA